MLKFRNKRFRLREYPKLKVGSVKDIGFELFDGENLVRRQFIIEYVGEVINADELNRRLKQFGVDSFHIMAINSTLFIDAGQKGNK